MMKKEDKKFGLNSDHIIEYKKKLLHESEISLWLDSYQDIFSDFDPRPYSQKGLSEDFLSEAKKASIDKSGGIELELLVPANKRDNVHEATIKKRLKEHFNKHYILLKKEINYTIVQGISFIVFGLILMFIATLILFNYGNSTILISFLIIVLEPGGWFLFWEGLGLVVFKSKTIRPNLVFYEKMSKSYIHFLSY